MQSPTCKILSETEETDKQSFVSHTLQTIHFHLLKMNNHIKTLWTTGPVNVTSEGSWKLCMLVKTVPRKREYNPIMFQFLASVFIDLNGLKII